MELPGGRNEFGLRMALGATSSQSLGHVPRRDLPVQVVAGIWGSRYQPSLLSRILMKWADGMSHDPHSLTGAVLNCF